MQFSKLTRSCLKSIQLAVLLVFITTPSYANGTNDSLDAMLAGLVINGEQIDTVDFFQEGDALWLDYALFIETSRVEQLPLAQAKKRPEFSALSSERMQANHYYSTPIGHAALSRKTQKVIQGKPYINVADIRDIGIRGRYLSSQTALVLDLPWAYEAQDKKAVKKRTQPEIDFAPEFAGITSVQSTFALVHNVENKQTDPLLTLDASGHLGAGTWALQSEHSRPFSSDDDEAPTASNNNEAEHDVTDLHWSTYNQHNALRLGTVTSPLNGVVSNSQYTGAQWAYSNKGIERHLSDSLYAGDGLLQSNRNNAQNIIGTGPKAGIAELRLDDRPVARLRIGLDGRYEFRNLNLGAHRTRRLTIALFEFSTTQKPVKIIDHSKLKRYDIVSTGEVLINTGVGENGNAFNNDEKSDLSTGFASAKYGVSNRVNLEAGFRKLQDQAEDKYLSAVVSIGAHTITSVTTAKLDDDQLSRQSAELYSEWSDASLELDATQDKHTDGTDGTEYKLYTRKKQNEHIEWSAIGEHQKNNGERVSHYLLPGVSWNNLAGLRLSAKPYAYQQSGAYYYNANWAPQGTGTSLGYGRNKTNHDASINQTINEQVSVGLSLNEGLDDNSNAQTLSLQHREFLSGRLSASVQHSEQQNSTQEGYQLSWSKNITPYTYLSLGANHNFVNQDLDLDDAINSEDESLEDYVERYSNVFLSLTTSFTRIDKRWANKSASGMSQKKGAIAGSIRNENGTPLDVESLAIRVDGRLKHTAITDGQSSYLLTGLKPGLHTVEVENTNLPIEYQADDTRYVVKVKPAATTDVSIQLTQSYGVSGRISRNNEPVADVTVTALSADNTEHKAVTSSYGYYQLLNLAPGEYTVMINNEEQSRITVTDDFIFGADFQL